MVKLNFAIYNVIIFVVLIFYIAFASFLTIEIGDMAIVNRMGALLSAIGALLVILQVIIEMAFEDGADLDKDNMRPGDILPSNADLAAGYLRTRRDIRQTSRLRVVIFIAYMVFCGEIMHGWGDLILERFISSPH